MVVLLQAIAVIGAKGFIATEGVQRDVNSTLLNWTPTNHEFTTAHAQNYTAPTGACGVAHNRTEVAGYVGSTRLLLCTLQLSPQGEATTILAMVLILAGVATVSIFGCMHAPRNTRLARIPDPPPWNPDSHQGQGNISFKAWTQRLMQWSILAVDLDEGQQCAAIVHQLGGSARELADNLSW